MFATPKLIAAGVVSLAIVSAGLWFWREAGNSTLIKIERQNNVSGDKSDSARSDYDRCIDGGGVYVNRTGKCSGANSGPQTSVKKFQTVLQTKKVYDGNIDGHIGEQTIGAIAAYPGGIKELIVDYCEERMRYLRSLSNAKTGFPASGRGWTIRVTGVDPLGKFKMQAGVVGNALKMVNSVTPLPTIAPVEAEAKAVVQDTGFAEVVKKPEAWGPLGGFLSAAVAIFAGAGPIQWALAILMIAGGIVGLVYFIQRSRSGG